MTKKLSFLDKFEKFALEKKVLTRRDKIVVGFSGGADSTALLLALWKLRTKFKLSILVAHVNYHLRGEDSNKDEEFVKQFCFKRNISLVIKSAKISSKSGMENSARDIRLNWFNNLKTVYKIHKTALGHNKKDQAETILFRIMRGSGYAGLKGIAPIADGVIHPLLPFSRAEIIQFLHDENVLWREDKSNSENIQSRNKIRNEMLPWIEKNMNPNVVERISQTAEIFEETDAILTNLAKRHLHKALDKHHNHTYVLSIPVLKKAKKVIRYYIYKEIYYLLSNTGKDFYQSSFKEIEAILDSKGSKQLDLRNDVLVLKEYEQLIFTLENPNLDVDVDNKKEFTSIRNRGTFEDKRIIMKKLKKLPGDNFLFSDKLCTYLDLDKIRMPLILRHRQPCDKFQPLGMKHSKKIKDFFIDEKVPKFERDNVVLFCDRDKILWVCGMRVDSRVAVSSSTQNILMIKVEKISTKRPRAAERVK